MASDFTLRMRRIRYIVSMKDAYPYITGENVYISDSPRQVRCKLHGEDRHPSARIYPDSGKFYCFTCGTDKPPLNAIDYYMAYNNISFEDRDSVEYMLKDFEKKFNLERYPLDNFKRSSDGDEFKVTYHYDSLFKDLWYEVHDRVCDSYSDKKGKMFEGLDLAWDKAFGDNKFKESWQFLFSFQEHFEEELRKY